MMRFLVSLAILTLLVALSGCAATPPDNGGSNGNGDGNGGDGDGTGGPLTITGTVTDASGTQDPTFSFTGGAITISATLGGTIPEGVVVSATISAPQAAAAQSGGTTITLTKGTGNTYSGTHTLGVNAYPQAQVYTVQVIATPTEGDAVTAQAGQATVNAPDNGPPGPPEL